MSQAVQALLIATVTLAAAVMMGCGDSSQQSPTVDRAERSLDLPPGLYNSVAWVGESQLAASHLTPVPGVVTTNTQSGTPESIAPARLTDCDGFEFAALASTGVGDLVYAERCAAVAATVASMPVDGGLPNERGVIRGRPFDAAWLPDDSVVLGTGDVLCSTLIRVAGGVGSPLPYVVEVDGEAFPVSQDLEATPERCAVDGRAGFPSVEVMTAKLAFLASSNGGLSGQGLLDRPWTLFVVEDDSPVAVVGGIKDPRDIAWMDASTILVSGSIEGSLGIWSVGLGETKVARVSELDVLDLAVSPDGLEVAAILSNPNQDVNSIEILQRPQ